MGDQYGLGNVRACGAKGDGITNDSAAFQRTIDQVSAAGGGTVLVPPSLSSYLIAGVSVTSGVAVEVSQGVTIKPASDADVVLIRPGSSWRGGYFDVRVGFTTGSVFAFDGSDNFNATSKRTILRDVRIEGAFRADKGTGIDMKSLGASGNIHRVLVENVAIGGCTYGIRMRVAAAVPADNWINGNSFRDVWLDNQVYGLTQEKSTNGLYLDANVFENLQIQCAADWTVRGVNVKGRANRFTFTIFDWDDADCIVLESDSSYNHVTAMGLAGLVVADAGTGNVIVKPYTV